MVAQIFTVIADVITNFTNCISSAFSGIMAVVWDGQALTTFGILLLIAFGVGIVYFALRYVLSLISLRRGK